MSKLTVLFIVREAECEELYSIHTAMDVIVFINESQNKFTGANTWFKRNPPRKWLNKESLNKVFWCKIKYYVSPQNKNKGVGMDENKLD